MCSRHLTTPSVLLSPSLLPSLSLSIYLPHAGRPLYLSAPCLSHLAANPTGVQVLAESRLQLNPGLHLSTPGSGVYCYLRLYWNGRWSKMSTVNTDCGEHKVYDWGLRKPQALISSGSTPWIQTIFPCLFFDAVPKLSASWFQIRWLQTDIL